jgi:hypothetical protein
MQMEEAPEITKDSDEDRIEGLTKYLQFQIQCLDIDDNNEGRLRKTKKSTRTERLARQPKDQDTGTGKTWKPK